MTEPKKDDLDRADELRRKAAEQSPGLLREFAEFVVHNKKWWLIPILLALAVLGLFVFLSNTAVAPFIYPF